LEGQENGNIGWDLASENFEQQVRRATLTLSVSGFRAANPESD
jgi:hypothetical protein